MIHTFCPLGVDWVIRCRPCLFSVGQGYLKRGGEYLYTPLASFTEAGVSSVYNFCAIVVDAENGLKLLIPSLRKCDTMREARSTAVFIKLVRMKT